MSETLDEIPFVAFGYDELRDLPKVASGDTFVCDRCGETHTFRAGTTDGKPTDTLLWYSCGESTYLGAVDGSDIRETLRKD